MTVNLLSGSVCSWMHLIYVLYGCEYACTSRLAGSLVFIDRRIYFVQHEEYPRVLGPAVFWHGKHPRRLCIPTFNPTTIIIDTQLHPVLGI